MAIFRFLRNVFGSVYSTIPFAIWLAVLFSANIPLFQEITGIQTHHIMTFTAISAMFYLYVQLSALNDYSRIAAHSVGGTDNKDVDRESARALLRKDIRLSRLPMIVIAGFCLFWAVLSLVPELYDRLPHLPGNMQSLSEWCNLNFSFLKGEIAFVYFLAVLTDMRFATKTDCLFDHIVKGQIDAVNHAGHIKK